MRVLPTRWRRKPTGIDTNRNYVTVTLCMGLATKRQGHEFPNSSHWSSIKSPTLAGYCEAGGLSETCSTCVGRCYLVLSNRLLCSLSHDQDALCSVPWQRLHLVCYIGIYSCVQFLVTKTSLFSKSFPLQPFFFFFRTDYMIPPDFYCYFWACQFLLFVFLFYTF